MKQVILPLLICLAFLVVLGIAIIAMPRTIDRAKEFNSGVLVFEAPNGDAWVEYRLPSGATHIMRVAAVQAILESESGDQRQRTTLYGAGFKFYVPFTSQEFLEASRLYQNTKKK